MSLEFANSVGLEVQKPDHEPRRFSIASGKIVEAVGRVDAQCSFAVGSSVHDSLLDCVFHVFNSLAVPVIMGLDFLQRTETLTRHRDRLIEEPVPVVQTLRVNSVGKPKQNLVCRLDTYVGCAMPDTGSDLNLVNPEFARTRAFHIEPAYEKLEFADCSTGYTSGVIRASFSVGDFSDLEGFLPRAEVGELEFYILDNLNADIIMGQDIIDDLDVFGSHAQSFIPSIPRIGESDVNIIRHIGRVERFVSKTWDRLKNKAQPGTPIGKLSAQPSLTLGT